MRWETANRTFLFVYVGMLAASLGFLMWFRARVIADMDQSVASAARVFDAAALRQPQDPAISFDLIDRLVESGLRNPFIDGIVVAKARPDGALHPVAPFYFPVLHPDWRAALEGWRQLDVRANDVLYGTVFVKMNRDVLRAINGATLAFALLLIGSVALTAWRVLTQQKALAQTTLALEEKQRQMIRMERLALAGQLTANIFHDIKKPVLNIKHAVQEELDSRHKDVAAAPTKSHPGILTEIQDQIGLFFNMLQEISLERFVRAQDKEQEYVDMNDIVLRSLSLVKYEQGTVRVDTKLARDLPLVLGYPYRMIQVISNLTLNAFQAMAGQGTLSVSTQCSDDGRRIIVEIADTGPGIPDKLRELVFAPFYTTQHNGEGSGLGLYIVRMICEDSGATVELTDAPDGGALFRVSWPAESP